MKGRSLDKTRHWQHGIGTAALGTNHPPVDSRKSEALTT